MGKTKNQKDMVMTNWDFLDNQMKEWATFFLNDVKISKEKTNRISSNIAEEISQIQTKSKKEIMALISNPIPIQKRLEELEAFQGWMDLIHNSKSPLIVRAQVIVQNYICFVYLGDFCFKPIRKFLEDGGVAKKCCNYLINNPIRAFRNALAHSNWKYSDDFSGITFYAHKGDQKTGKMEEWIVSQKDLAFWQALARCTAYTVLLSLNFNGKITRV